jgi:acyl-CoA thioester hydrolase
MIELKQAECELSLRVRYPECDPRGILHHARYFEYFELGRTELLRVNGVSYRELEACGRFFVVARMRCRFNSPAHYDDRLTLGVRHVLATYARIDHRYRLYRGEKLLCSATSSIACVDSKGVIVPLTELESLF